MDAILVYDSKNLLDPRKLVHSIKAMTKVITPLIETQVEKLKKKKVDATSLDKLGKYFDKISSHINDIDLTSPKYMKESNRHFLQ